MAGMWLTPEGSHQEGAGNSRREARFTTTSIVHSTARNGPQHPEPEPQVERRQRPAGKTTAEVRGNTEGTPEQLPDGRIALSVRETGDRAWKGIARVVVDPTFLDMPHQVEGALKATPPGSPITVRGAWQRSDGQTYTLASNYVSTPTTAAAWAAAGREEPRPPPVIQRPPRGQQDDGAGL